MSSSMPTCKPLERLLKFHSDLVEKKQNNVIESLESGRSKFDILSCLAGGSVENGNDSVRRDSTFIDTMKILYARGDQNGDGSIYPDDPDKDNKLQSLILS